MTVPDVVLSPNVDADSQVVIDAADRVDRMLPHPPPVQERRGFTLSERLDPITLEQMKALMRAVI